MSLRQYSGNLTTVRRELAIATLVITGVAVALPGDAAPRAEVAFLPRSPVQRLGAVFASPSTP